MPEGVDPQSAPLMVEILVQVMTGLIFEYGPRLLGWIGQRLDLFRQRRIRYVTRRTCTPDQYRQFGTQVYDAVLKAFPTFTEADWQSMIAEVLC